MALLFQNSDASQEHFVVQGRTCLVVASLLGCGVLHWYGIVGFDAPNRVEQRTVQ